MAPAMAFPSMYRSSKLYKTAKSSARQAPRAAGPGMAPELEVLDRGAAELGPDLVGAAMDARYLRQPGTEPAAFRQARRIQVRAGRKRAAALDHMELRPVNLGWESGIPRDGRVNRAGRDSTLELFEIEVL